MSEPKQEAVRIVRERDQARALFEDESTGERFDVLDGLTRQLIDVLTAAIHVRLQHSPVLPQNADGYDLAIGELENALRALGVDFEYLSALRGEQQ